MIAIAEVAIVATWKPKRLAVCPTQSRKKAGEEDKGERERTGAV